MIISSFIALCSENVASPVSAFGDLLNLSSWLRIWLFCNCFTFQSKYILWEGLKFDICLQIQSYSLYLSTSSSPLDLSRAERVVWLSLTIVFILSSSACNSSCLLYLYCDYTFSKNFFITFNTFCLEFIVSEINDYFCCIFC